MEGFSLLEVGSLARVLITFDREMQALKPPFEALLTLREMFSLRQGPANPSVVYQAASGLKVREEEAVGSAMSVGRSPVLSLVSKSGRNLSRRARIVDALQRFMLCQHHYVSSLVIHSTECSLRKISVHDPTVLHQSQPRSSLLLRFIAIHLLSQETRTTQRTLLLQLKVLRSNQLPTMKHQLYP